MDKRYFMFTFERGYVFHESDNGEFPSIKQIRETWQMEKFKLFSIFEFKNKKDYESAMSVE